MKKEKVEVQEAEVVEEERVEIEVRHNLVVVRVGKWLGVPSNRNKNDDIVSNIGYIHHWTYNPYNIVYRHEHDETKLGTYRNYDNMKYFFRYGSFQGECPICNETIPNSFKKLIENMFEALTLGNKIE